MAKNVWWFCIISMLLAACVQLRPYVSSEQGGMNLRVKNEMGQGIAVKKFFITASGDIINRGDSKERLRYYMGPPDDIQFSLDGYEAWRYSSSAVAFYFDDGHIRSIHSLKDEPLTQ